jgi:hypothetical protein
MPSKTRLRGISVDVKGGALPVRTAFFLAQNRAGVRTETFDERFSTETGLERPSTEAAAACGCSELPDG